MILIVAEKPSVGRVIASVVGAEERHEGYIQGSGYIVSWCLGHLVTLQAPNDSRKLAVQSYRKYKETV